MLYTDFKVGNDDYKLRLNTRDIASLERLLNGKHPLLIFGNGDDIPSVTIMVNILHISLQAYQHNISLDDAFNIFDAYLAEGHTTTDFIPVILDIFKVSGIVAKDAKKGETKNA